MAERCVVGFDGSDPSRAALRWALASGLPVVLVHVTDAEAGMMAADYLEEKRHQGAQIVAEALKAFPPRPGEPEVEVAMLEGPVAWALTAFAQPADLLVVGTHKTGFLRGRVLGSRSVEVALLARSDVVVVPDTDLRLRSGVVAGIVEGPEMASVVEVAAREAQARGEELLLLHGSAEFGYERGQTLVAAAREIAHAVAPEIVVTSRVSNRSVAELLLDAGRGRALLVIGAGARDLVRSPIGSLLHDILLNLTAPTRVVHTDQPTAPMLTKPAGARRDR